ncbi:MAG: glycosyltransferase [Chloroflexota bacterium]|nr:glycosyltransferase [Chloroflexota bacterium]
MIRILYVVDSLMAGGIESQLLELASGLDRTRFEPHILCLYGPRTRDLHFAPAVRAAAIPLYTLDMEGSAWDKGRGVVHIIATAQALQPQLIQAEGYHANLLTRLAAPCLPGIRLIGSVRGMHSAKQLFYERLSHRLCRVLVVNGPHLKTMLSERAGVPACKVCCIPNGITTQRFSQPRDADLRQRIAPHDQRVFASLGRISFEKNMHWIAEGFGLLKRQQRLPDGVRCFIVGPVQDIAAKKALDAAILRDTLAQTVIYHTQTPHPEDYYHACDATILYSPAEGLPNVCLESLAAGCPVIISSEANAAHVIEHGITGWVVPAHDRLRLAETLHTAITLPESVLSRMREACLQSAQHYRVETLVQRYTNLYEGMAR